MRASCLAAVAASLVLQVAASAAPWGSAAAQFSPPLCPSLVRSPLSPVNRSPTPTFPSVAASPVVEPARRTAPWMEILASPLWNPALPLR